MRFAPGVAALLLVVAYAGTLGAGFVYDDYPYVVDNPDLRGGLDRVPRLFAVSFPSHAPERALYRPVTALTYRLDRLGARGIEPWRHHATNLVLAALLVLAAHAALRRLLTTAAAAAGAFVFAVHPVHVEAVAWVTGRSEVLAALFACLSFAWGVDVAAGRRGGLAAAGSAIALVAGVLSKENAAVALPLLGLAAGLAGQLRRRGAVAVLGTNTAALAAALALRSVVLGGFAPEAGLQEGAARWSDRLPLVAAAAGEHLRLLVAPFPLHVERMPVAPRGWGDGSVMAGLAVLGALAALAAWLAGTRRRTALTLLLWPIVALAPVSHLVPIGETVAERFLLLPSVGWCGLAGLALASPGPGCVARRAALAALVVAGFAGTAIAARTWNDGISLWRNAVLHAPAAPGAWAGLGDAYALAGEPEQAVVRYRRALELDPGLTVARLALATALESTGRRDEALAESERAVQIDPDHPAALNNLGARWMRAGRRDEAAVLFGRAVAIAPGYAPALRNAALAALEGGRPEEAASLLARAKAADPNLPGLAEMEARLGDRGFALPLEDR